MGFSTPGFAFPLGVVFSGIDKVSGPLAQIENRITSFGVKTAKFGRDLTLGLTAPLAAAGGFVLKTAMEYESGMNRLLAVTGANEEEFAKLKETARELGASSKGLGFNALQVGDAMYFMAQGGFTATEVLEGIQAVLNLAAAGEMELAEAAEIAVVTLRGMQMEVGDLGRVVDVMATGNIAGVTTVQELGTAFARSAPIARSFGLDVEDLGAALTSLATVGFPEALGGTSMKMMLDQLGKTDVQKKLATFGILPQHIFDANGKLRSFVGTMALLREADFSGPELLNLFGSRAGPGFAALLGLSQKELVAMRTAMDEAGGSAERLATTMTGGAKGGLKQFNNGLTDLKIAIADSGMLEDFTELTKTTRGWVKSLAEASPETLGLTVKIGLFAAALGPALFLVGKMAVALGWLVAIVGAFGLGPVALMTGAAFAIGGAARVIVDNWSALKAWFTGFFDWFGSKISAFTGWLDDIYGVKPGGMSIFEWIGQSQGFDISAWLSKIYGVKPGSGMDVAGWLSELYGVESRDAQAARIGAAASSRTETIRRQEQRVEVSIQGLPPGGTVRTYGEGIASLEVGKVMGPG